MALAVVVARPRATVKSAWPKTAGTLRRYQGSEAGQPRRVLDNRRMKASQTFATVKAAFTT